MSDPALRISAGPAVLSLAQLIQNQPATTPCLVEPGLLPTQGILFVGGEPKVGKSLLVANLALALAAGCDQLGFSIPVPRRVLVCQFELPLPHSLAAWPSCGRAWGSPLIIICWSTPAPLVICSVRPRAGITCLRRAGCRCRSRHPRPPLFRP
jgi:hypothetical protein